MSSKYIECQDTDISVEYKNGNKLELILESSTDMLELNRYEAKDLIDVLVEFLMSR